MPHRRPPRIASFDYLGPYRYFVTCCTRERQVLFVEPHVVEALSLQIRQSCIDRQFALFAYAFMPDHLHLLVGGLAPNASFKRLMMLSRARTAIAFHRFQHQELWQDGYYERVLRDEESTERVAGYIIANPVRAGLVKRVDEYPFQYSWRPVEFACPD